MAGPESSKLDFASFCMDDDGKGNGRKEKEDPRIEKVSWEKKGIIRRFMTWGEMFPSFVETT